MKFLIWPFYGQQDKLTNKFKLVTCADMQWCRFIQSKLLALGHNVTFITPLEKQCADPLPEQRIAINMPTCNRERRLWWPHTAVYAASNSDVVLCMHDTAGYKLKQLTKARVVQFLPAFMDAAPWCQDLHLFKAAWEHADLCVTYGVQAAYTARCHGLNPVVWGQAYDDREYPQVPMQSGTRDIDLLFVCRASATNYTFHKEFIDAVPKGKRVIYVDVTNYMRQQKLVPEDQLFVKSTQAAFHDLLLRSKYAVSLRDDDYGGFSIRQAVRCGAYPVLLETEAYKSMAGVDWPLFCSIAGLKDDLHFALETTPTHSQEAVLISNVAKESYQQGWLRAKEDLKL